jgi:pyruvate decarboxylase
MSRSITDPCSYLQAYNDIQPWKFKDLPAVFGATPENHATYVVKTPQEMEKLLNDQKFGDAEVLQVSLTFRMIDDIPILFPL